LKETKADNGSNELASAKGEVLVYQTEAGEVKVDVRLEDGTVWLTQAQIAELFQVKPQNITMHLKNIFAERELDAVATCKDFLQVQIGKSYWPAFGCFQMIGLNAWKISLMMFVKST